MFNWPAYLRFKFLAPRLLKLLRCGFGCVLGGEFDCFGSVWELASRSPSKLELGSNTTHAPAGFVRRTYRASIKEVAIHCGWVGEARAGRILIENHGVVSFHQSSRRDSPQCVV